MPSWQVTATTVRCDAVDDEITLLVYRDWSVKCTGSRGEGSVRRSGCTGPECRLALDYMQKLMAEEERPA